MSLNKHDWQFQRGLAERQREHEEFLAAKEREAEERRRANEEARRQWRAKLDRERAARQAEADAELERQLAPERERLMREWLAEHPGQTAETFKRVAWPQLRVNIIAEREHLRCEAEYQNLRGYDF